MGKGADFERTICKQLSFWWSGQDRDDIFWRSSNSGGRATIRGRKGKQTFGQHGDITAVDPFGAPLLDILALEIKRGYGEADFHALLDRSSGAAQQVWESWIQQAIASAEGSGAYSWAIIARRDRKEPIIVLEKQGWDVLQEFKKHTPTPLFRLSCSIRFRSLVKKEKVKKRIKGKLKTRNSNTFSHAERKCSIVGMRFEDFLKAFDRFAFTKASKLV